MARKTNRGSSTVLIVLLLVGLLLVAYFAIPSFKAFIDSLLNKVGAGNYFGMEITYADGTKRTYEPTTVPGTLYEYDTNKAVTNVRVMLKMTATFTGTVSSFSGSFLYMMTLKDPSMIAIKTFEDNSAQTFSSSATLTSGTPIMVWYRDYTGTFLESNIPTTDEKYYYVWGCSSFTVKLTFSDGNVAEKTLGINGVHWACRKSASSGLNGLSITWGTQV